MGKVTEMSLDGLDPMFSETPTRQGLCPWCSAPCAGSFCDYCCREVESRRQTAMILQVNVEMGLVRSVCARAKHRRKSRAGNFADSCEQCGHVIALDADNVPIHEFKCGDIERIADRVLAQFRASNAVAAATLIAADAT